MTPDSSAKKRSADGFDRGCPFDPLPPCPRGRTSLFVSAVLLGSILLLGCLCLEMILPTISAVVRWPALFAMPMILGGIVFLAGRDRP